MGSFLAEWSFPSILVTCWTNDSMWVRGRATHVLMPRSIRNRDFRAGIISVEGFHKWNAGHAILLRTGRICGLCIVKPRFGSGSAAAPFVVESDAKQSSGTGVLHPSTLERLPTPIETKWLSTNSNNRSFKKHSPANSPRPGNAKKSRRNQPNSAVWNMSHDTT